MEFGIINNSNTQFNSSAPLPVHSAPDQAQTQKVAPVPQSDSHNKAATDNNGSSGNQAAMGEQQRKEMVERGAEQVRKAFTPKMVRFTIFKGPDGQYITRFTDLNDGSVRYIPEPEIMDYMRKLADLHASLVDTQA